jgi:hypothetical protein
MRKKPNTKKPAAKKSKSNGETTFSSEATTLVERAHFLEVSTNIRAGAGKGDRPPTGGSS